MKKEIILTIGMLAVAGLCMFSSMTPMMYVGVHALAIFLFVLFAVAVWREKSVDEREERHKAVASDLAFTVTGALIGIAMIYQIYTDMKIDVWLMAILAGMILSRVATRYWLNKHN